MAKNDQKSTNLVLIIPCIYNKQLFLPTNQEDADFSWSQVRDYIVGLFLVSFYVNIHL